MNSNHVEMFTRMAVRYPEVKCKMVLVGEASVGKTALVTRFARGRFYENQESTIGAAFVSKPLIIHETLVHMEMWDTAGQERFHSLVPMYYRGAQAAIIVYEIPNRDSFERAKAWVRELYRHASPDIIIALVGNKLDLADIRAVPYEEGMSFAAEHGLMFYETSARADKNIRKLMWEIAEKFARNVGINDENAAAGGEGRGNRLQNAVNNGMQRINNCCQ